MPYPTFKDKYGQPPQAPVEANQDPMVEAGANAPQMNIPQMNPWAGVNPEEQQQADQPPGNPWTYKGK